jgi:hypothetical protein
VLSTAASAVLLIVLATSKIDTGAIRSGSKREQVLP